MNRRRLGAVGAVLAAAMVVAGCHKPDPNATSEKPAAREPVPVKLGKVTSKQLPRRLDVTGTLDAEERSEIAAQAGGVVLNVPIDLGVRVKRGDLLIELDPREAKLRLASASATEQQQLARLGIDPGKRFEVDAVADVKAAKEALEQAETDYKRTLALYTEGALPKAQLDLAESNKQRAEAQYEMAKNGVGQAVAGLGAAQAQSSLSQKTLEDTKVRAPFDGVIAEKRISPGEFASPGRVVAVLVKDDILRFRFDVSEADIGLVVAGAHVDVHVAAYPGRSFPGVVKHLGASVKLSSRTLPVEAEVLNDKFELKPGLFARATVSLGGDPVPTMLVPESAVGTTGNGYHVFVRNGDHVEERLVTRGALFDDQMEVRGQLTEGDEIVLDAVDKLSDSAPITVQ
ncbi:MAG: efflux RND transporter periplasmic adaptor subunit [Polyangiaceae bacterium]